jgi:hypothetical protein
MDESDGKIFFRDVGRHIEEAGLLSRYIDSEKAASGLKMTIG